MFMASVLFFSAQSSAFRPVVALHRCPGLRPIRAADSADSAGRVMTGRWLGLPCRVRRLAWHRSQAELPSHVFLFLGEIFLGKVLSLASVNKGWPF